MTLARFFRPVLRGGLLAAALWLPLFSSPDAAATGLVSAGSGRDVRLKGRVVRAGDRAPVAGAVVAVSGRKEEARTDADGRFDLFLVSEASGSGIVLRVSADGFDPAAATVPPGEADVEIVLAPAVFVLPGTRDVVVEAAGLERPAFELPYAGRSLGRDEVLSADATGLQAAVARVPGVSFVGGGYHSAPTIRGVARNRVVLLVDGVRTAAVRTIGGHLGFVHPFAVEAVEVVKGPFSTLYGHDAMAGVIRVDTLRPKTGPGGFTLSGGGLARLESAASGRNGAFYLSGGIPEAAFLVSYGRISEEDYRMGGGGRLDRSGFSLASLLLKGEFRPADRHRFELLYLRTDGRDIGKASGDPTLVNVHPSEKNDILSLDYEWTAGGTLVRAVEARLSRGLFALSSDFRTVSGSRTVQSLRDLAEDGYGLTVKTTMTPLPRLVLFAGLDAYFQENQRIDGVRNIRLEGRDAPVSSVPLDEVPEVATRDAGLFVQGTAVLGERWSLVFGARGDAFAERVEDGAGARTRTFRTQWNGNAGLVHALSPSLRLSLNVGTAFRLPTPKDRYFNGQTPAGINIGNPDLRPERGLNTDLVLKFRSGPGRGGFRFEGSLAAFLDRFRDLIVIRWDRPAGIRTGVFQNAGRAEIYGLEAEASVAAADGWSLDAAATAAGAAVHGNDEVLDDLPPFGGLLRIRRSFGRGAVALSLRGAAAERRTSAGDLPAAAFLAADFSADWKLGSAWRLRAAVENIADASYREFFDLPAVRRRGRSFSLSLAAEL